MNWKAFLKGHEFDLYELRALFSSGDTQVIKDGDEYYLSSVEVDNRPAGEEFYRAAERVLAIVNGVGQANNSSFRPVALVGRFRDGDSNQHHVVVADTVEARSYVYAAAVVTNPAGDEVSPPPPPGPDRVSKAMRHPDAMEALRLMGKPEPTTWIDLYKVYEIIRDAMGGEAGLIRAGLATKPDISAFTGSANLPSVSGEDARHARLAGTPKRTMHIAEARDFIGRLLWTWVDSLH